MTPEIFRIVLQFQHPSAWQVAFEQAEKRRQEQAGAERSRKYANEQSDDPDRQISDAERSNWQRFARYHENHAEQYRQAILAWVGELLQVQNYCRLNAPQVLPMIPNVDPFGTAPDNYQALADRMVEVEAALRIALKPAGRNESGKPKRTRATPLEDAELLADFEAQEEPPIAEFAAGKGKNESTVRKAIERATAAREAQTARQKAIRNRSRE